MKSKSRQGKLDHFRYSQFKAVYCRQLLMLELQIVRLPKTPLFNLQCIIHSQQLTGSFLSFFLPSYLSFHPSFFLTQLVSTFLLPPPSLFSWNTKTERLEERIGRKRNWFNWPTMPINVTKKKPRTCVTLCRIHPRNHMGKNIYHY